MASIFEEVLKDNTRLGWWKMRWKQHVTTDIVAYQLTLIPTIYRSPEYKHPDFPV